MYAGKFCSLPFDTLQIDHDGDVQLCDCQYHMPYTIGNIYKNTLTEIWNSESGKKVRQSVLDEEFTYCSWNCSHLPLLPLRPQFISPVPEFPVKIKIDLDRSCNLKCASCRETTIMEKNGTRIQKQIEIFDEIKQWAVSNPTKILKILPMASGEIFASHSGLHFLNSLTNLEVKNIKLHITTNGTLLFRNRDMLIKLNELISQIDISIDAATPETYALVRGGDWSELMQGIEFVKNHMQTPLSLNFCIQQQNWKEIEQFANLGVGFGANVRFQKLLDWGHWTIAWWHDNNVFDRKRPEFKQALEKLRCIQQKHGNKIGMTGELTKYLLKS